MGVKAAVRGPRQVNDVTASSTVHRRRNVLAHSSRAY